MESYADALSNRLDEGRTTMARDEAKAEAFAAQMLTTLNGGLLSLLISVGHQTGLFDVLAKLPASNAEAIARAAGLQERYVREWLGALVMGRIISYDSEEHSYFLPDEHAACLTRAAGADNLAGLAQFVPLLAGVERAILEAFRQGGGVPYSAFERFHEVMAEDTRVTQNAVLIPRTLPLIPGLTARLEAGIDVVDIGCGRGVVTTLLASQFPRSRFLGIDIAAEAIAWATAEAARQGLRNARFETRDAATFGGEPGYDFITAFDAIHDQALPRRVLRAARERLRPGGVFLMVDIAASSRLERNLDNPLAPFLYTVSTLHCTPVSLAAGGEGLGACWGEEKARELLGEAGFTDVEVRRVEGDAFNAYFVCRVAE